MPSEKPENYTLEVTFDSGPLAGKLIARHPLVGVVEKQHPLTGRSAPEFSAKDLDGKPITLRGLRGRVVLLDFWATWCGPCVAAMPHLQRIAEQYRSKGVAVIGVNQDHALSPEDVAQFVKEKDVTYPQIVDSEGSVAKLFSVRGLPTLAVIDPHGQIRAVHMGFPPDGEKKLVQQVESLLTNRASASTTRGQKN